MTQGTSSRPRVPCSACGGPTGYFVTGTQPNNPPVCHACRRSAAKCGTAEGRGMHRRRGEKPCDPCRLAWNEACKESRATAASNTVLRQAAGIAYREGGSSMYSLHQLVDRLEDEHTAAQEKAAADARREALIEKATAAYLGAMPHADRLTPEGRTGITAVVDLVLAEVES